MNTKTTMIKIVAWISMSLLISKTSAQSVCNVPISFFDWTANGIGNGNWVVQPGGSWVHQTENGDPIFFVSPTDYFNVHIAGEFYCTDPGDDDWMGFVFGYQGPFGLDSLYSFYAFDWKKLTSGGGSEGFALVKYDGIISQDSLNSYFWKKNPVSSTITILDTLFGHNGWTENQNYKFDLIYTSTNITILIDGQEIFNIDGCYEPGRFGYYNYSQRDVFYGNFSYRLATSFNVEQSRDFVCEGESVSMVAVDSCGSNSTLTKWEWDFGDGQTDNQANTSHTYTSPGTYPITLIVEDADGCQDTVSKTVEIKALPPIEFSSSEPSCHTYADGWIQASSHPNHSPYQYNWHHGDTDSTAEFLQTGTYTVSVIDKFGCKNKDSLFLGEPEPLQVALTELFPAYCNIANGEGEAIVIGGTIPYMYRWGGLTAQTSPTSNQLAPGINTLVIIDDNGCVLTDSLFIDHIPPATPRLFISPDPNQPILESQDISVIDSSLGAISRRWIWDDGTIDTSLEASHSYLPGLYTLTLEVDNGFNCPEFQTVELEIISDGYLKLPTAFTPNGDGLNDFYGPVQEGLAEFDMVIYNRWGKLIYQSTNPISGWDGTYKGKAAPEGTYVCKVQAKKNDGQFLAKETPFNLIR